MTITTRAACILATPLMILTVPALAGCKLGQLLEMPVHMVGTAPVVSARINGADAQFIIDSGAFYSVMPAATAAQFQLRQESAPDGLRINGVGGSTRPSVVTVKEFGLGTTVTRRIEFLVAGSDFGNGLDGVLGQNLLGIADAEYDLAQGVIRLIRPHGCGKEGLSYWAGSTPVSLVEINMTSPLKMQAIGNAYVNGAKIRVMFDTGASASALSRRAAARAGVKVDDPGVVAAGASFGVGRVSVDTWIAPVASFKIGDEEIRNTRLRIGNFDLDEIDMLLGADFFLSHHVYIANSQGRVYFTYNGGPVFNLKTIPASPASDAAAAAIPAPQGANDPADAPGFSRRGTAFAARHDYVHAIADLTQACTLAPNEPEYFYQRALALWSNHQGELARPDLDRVLTLKPDHLEALMTRMELRLQQGDQEGALADLATADHLAAPESAVRSDIGDVYMDIGRLPEGIAQYDLWIAAHAQDGKLANILNSRCWARGLLGRDLDQALKDCNRSLSLRRDSANTYDSRGLVQFRRGEYRKSIADYDTALKLDPKQDWSLYVRGIDHLRLGQTDAGKADIDAAIAISPQIAEEAKKYGVVP